MLLDSILLFGNAQAAVDGQGNSGEFDNAKAAKECAEFFEKAKKDFIEIFAITTGWKPVYDEGTEASQWTESWTLEKV